MIRSEKSGYRQIASQLYIRRYNLKDRTFYSKFLFNKLDKIAKEYEYEVEFDNVMSKSISPQFPLTFGSEKHFIEFVKKLGRSFVDDHMDFVKPFTEGVFFDKDKVLWNGAQQSLIFFIILLHADGKIVLSKNKWNLVSKCFNTNVKRHIKSLKPEVLRAQSSKLGLNAIESYHDVQRYVEDTATSEMKEIFKVYRRVFRS